MVMRSECFASATPEHFGYIRGKMITIKGFRIVRGEDGIHLSGPVSATTISFARYAVSTTGGWSPPAISILY